MPFISADFVIFLRFLFRPLVPCPYLVATFVDTKLRGTRSVTRSRATNVRRPLLEPQRAVDPAYVPTNFVELVKRRSSGDRAAPYVVLAYDGVAIYVSCWPLPRSQDRVLGLHEVATFRGVSSSPGIWAYGPTLAVS